jgi:uncharacterized protein
MKQITTMLFAICIIATAAAKDVTGYWNGVLKRANSEVRICYKISKTKDGLKGEMFCPTMGIKHFPITSVTFDSITLKISSNEAKLDFEGTFLTAGKSGTDSILGRLKDGGVKPIFMNLGKGIPDTLVRPQEPQKPFAYHVEEVTFENKKAKINLSGTLSLPRKTGYFPVVVLLSTFGQQNRDEEMYGHKMFLVLTDNLVKNGVGVLRYDDRGTGNSGGDFKTATLEDFKEDAQAAIAYLQTKTNVNKELIGVLGHGEGAIVASMMAADDSKKDVKFVVSLGGAGLNGDKLLLMQNEIIGRANGVDESTLKQSYELNRGAYDIIQKTMLNSQIKPKLVTYLKQAVKDTGMKVLPDSLKSNQVAIQKFKSDSTKYAEKIDKLLEEYSNPWLQYFVKYNPTSTLEKVKCPILVYNGGKDLKIAGKQNLEAIVAALQKGGNTQYDSKLFPNANDMFQSCKTGLPNEYQITELTIAPAILTEMTKWIVEKSNGTWVGYTNR